MTAKTGPSLGVYAGDFGPCSQNRKLELLELVGEMSFLELTHLIT